MTPSLLTLDGLTVVPLRRISSDYLLEGWLHYEEGSYRYYRHCPGPVRLVLHHTGGQAISLHADRSRREMEVSPFDGAHDERPIPHDISDVGAMRRAQDTFTEAAVVVHGDGPMPWKFKVHACFGILSPVAGEASTRAEAVKEADKVLSKFLVQDVHDDPVDLRSIAREIDALRSMLSTILSVRGGDIDAEMHRWGPAAVSGTIHMCLSIQDAHAALQLLGLPLHAEQVAK